MRGSAFLAVFLILVGVVFITATIRGRAPLLYDAIAESAGGSSAEGGGQRGGRQVARTQAARRRA